MQRQFQRLHEIRQMIFHRKWEVATREIETIDHAVKLIKRNKINLYAMYLIEKKELNRATHVLRNLNEDISGTLSSGISLGLLSYLEYVQDNKFEAQQCCIKAISLLETMEKTTHKYRLSHLYCQLFLTVCYTIMAHICCINTQFKRAYDYLIKTKHTVFNRFKDAVDILIEIVEQMYKYKLAFGGVREESFRNIENYEIITKRLEQLAKYHHQPNENKGIQLYNEFDKGSKTLVQQLYRFTFVQDKPRKSVIEKNVQTERLPVISKVSKKKSITLNKKKDIEAAYEKDVKKEEVRSESQPKLGSKKSVKLASGVTLSKNMQKKLAIYDIITNPLFQGLADEFKKKKLTKKQTKRIVVEEELSPILPTTSVINEKPRNQKNIVQEKIDEIKEQSVKIIEQQISQKSNDSDGAPFPEHLTRHISRNANMNILPLLGKQGRDLSQEAPNAQNEPKLNRSNTLAHELPSRFGTQPDDNKFVIRLMSQQRQGTPPPLNDVKSAKDNEVTKDFLKIPLQRTKSVFCQTDKQINASILQPSQLNQHDQMKGDQEGTKSEIAYRKQLSLDTTINNQLIRSLNICLQGQKHSFKTQYSYHKSGTQNCSQIMQLFLNDCRNLDEQKREVVSAFLWLLNQCIKQNMGQAYAQNNDASEIPLLANKLIDTHQKFIASFPASVQVVIDLTEAFFIWLYRKKFTRHLVREILQ